MKLKAVRDYRNQISYKTVDDSGKEMPISELLARYKVGQGEFENAKLVGEEIVITEERTNVVEKSDKRLEIERRALSKIGNSKYEVEALIYEKGKLIAYQVNDLHNKHYRLTPPTAIIYASIGALTNATIDFVEGVETVVGKNIDLNNLAVIGEKEVLQRTLNGVRTSDGTVKIKLDYVLDTMASLKNVECFDARNDEFNRGYRLPKLVSLKTATMQVVVSNIKYDVTFPNIGGVLSESETQLILDILDRESDKLLKVIVEDATVMEIQNGYNVAIAAFAALKTLNRKAVLNEVSIINEYGKVWRMFTKESKAKEEKEDVNAPKVISADEVRTLPIRYSINISEISANISSSEHSRLINELKLGRAKAVVICEDNKFETSKFVIVPGERVRIDFSLKDANGEEKLYCYKELDSKKVNIKNILLICAACVGKDYEIKSASMSAIGRDSEYLLLFSSKIR